MYPNGELASLIALGLLALLLVWIGLTGRASEAIRRVRAWVDERKGSA